jgi:hypothetical protein
MGLKKMSWLLFWATVSCLGQDRAEFTRGKEFYIKGNATVIGNSILGKSSTKAFDKPDKINDEFKMRYIDVDNDPTTWSSSTAALAIPEKSSIVHASLLWTATYYGEKSGERLSDNALVYKKLEERAHNPQMIKLQPPNGAYIDITGSLIYDGENAKNRTIKSRAPYAYIADVTEILKGYYKGDITVANVAATQGKMNGGSSAGWLLYVVFENETQPFQYITTYYGLESIKKEEVEIDFGSFRSSENGELETQITIGALEGDSNLDKDQIRIYNPKSELFLPLGNKVRPSNNFFNSSITSGEDIVLSRTPSSKNTLGFDIAQVTLDQELNTTLANSSQGVKMQFITRGDHYFLFFTAFQTTVNEAYYSEKLIKQSTTTPQAVVEIQTPSEPVEAVQTTTTPRDIPETQSEPAPPVITKEPLVTAPTIELDGKPSADVPGMLSGFYIISNVFSSETNAIKWQQTLSSKGLFSNTFLRPDNNLYYVSLGNNKNPIMMYELLKTIREDEDLAKSWILKINM